MSKFLVVDGRGGWLNARALDTREDEIAGDHSTQLRWTINPRILGMPKGPFRISRFEQVPITLTGMALTQKKIELANQGEDSWADVETVGLPVDETWQGLYSTEPQGPFESGNPPNLSPIDAAILRLKNGAPVRGWDSLNLVMPLSPQGLAKTQWRGPDPQGFVLGLAASDLLASVREMLTHVQDPRKQLDFEATRTQSPHGLPVEIRSPLGGSLADLGPDPSGTASWHPLGALLLAAAVDPFTALALGFGCGLLPFVSGASNLAYRISLAIGTDASGETIEIADIVWALPVPPRPVKVTGVAVRRLAIIQPLETDDALMDSVEVAWDHPLSPQDTPFSNAPYPTSYAIARLLSDMSSVEILLTPREQVDGWLPFVATRADAGPITFSDNLVSARSQGLQGTVIPPGRSATYAVAAQDMFGRWSPWATVDYRGLDEPAQSPGVQSLTINSDGELEVIFCWDWTTRSPESVELVGEIENVAASPVFDAQVNFAGNATPTLGGLRVAPLNQSLNVCNWGPEQDQPAANHDFRVRYYRLTASLGPDTGVPQRTFQVKARGQCHLHHQFSPMFNLRGFTEPRKVVVYSNLSPDSPGFDGQPTEAPLWASVRDAAGLSRFVVQWQRNLGAVGYVLYEAAETGVLAALGGGDVDTAGSYVTRLANLRELLRHANLLDIRKLFRRVNKELIPETSQEVTLPRGSGVIYLYAVTAVNANRIESAWTANGDTVLAVAVPQIRVPSPPILQVSAAVSDGGVPGVCLKVALSTDTKLGRVDIYRTTKPELATNVDKMGPPVPNLSVTGEMLELKDIGIDVGIKPGWGKIYYRAVCWSLRDDKKGFVEARSLASPAVSVIVPPSVAPQIFDLQVNEPGSTETEALISWGTNAPVALTPLGYHDAAVDARSLDGKFLIGITQRLDMIQAFATGDHLPAASPDKRQIMRVGAPEQYRLYAWLPRPPGNQVFNLTVKMIDPLGRMGKFDAPVPAFHPDVLPQLSPITFTPINSSSPSGLQLVSWRILSPVLAGALHDYLFRLEISLLAPEDTLSIDVRLDQAVEIDTDFQNFPHAGFTLSPLLRIRNTQEYGFYIVKFHYKVDIRLTDSSGRIVTTHGESHL